MFRADTGKKQEKTDNKIDNEISNMKFRLIVSLVCLVPLMYISMGHMWGWPFLSVFHGAENGITFALTQMLLTLPIMYVNRKYYITGFKTLFHGAPNMDSLIAIGSGAAFTYGIIAIYCIGYGLGHGDRKFAHSYMMNLYFESAAMILALITLGKFLESRAKGKTSQAIEKLIDLSPKTAVVIRDGKEVTVGVDDVQIGEIVVVKAGQSVPLDGVIVEGNGAIDESAITGESIAVEKNVGDKVIGATINKSGYFKKSPPIGTIVKVRSYRLICQYRQSGNIPILFQICPICYHQFISWSCFSPDFREAFVRHSVLRFIRRTLCESLVTCQWQTDAGR